MKINYSLLTVVFLVLSVPMAWMFLEGRRARQPVPVVRFASFNVAMNRPEAGAMLAELRTGESEQGRRIAEIVQRNAVDVILLCEVDRDSAAEAVKLLAERYLAVGQGGQRPIEFAYSFCGEVNTGVPTGRDIDGDGASDGPADAHGYGRFPGQYGMAVLSRHPILRSRVRTFQLLPWHLMPDAQRPPDFWSDETWRELRLSSKSHWDVPIGVGPVDKAHVVHLLCSHPTPPAFDGAEDRNGRRNHDEIRFWVDYLTPGRDGWIVDDAGVKGGLPLSESFVIAGDLNCDPADGSSRREALLELLACPRVHDTAPRSAGGEAAAMRQWGVNAEQRGDAALDTGDFGDEPPRGPGNLRVDYCLPSKDLHVHGSGVFWPLAHEPGAALVGASDHRLVWIDLEMR